MKERYTLNELALMTSLTTRTLRNYLQKGLLNGEKVDGSWTFTVADIEAFMAEPAARKAMQSNRNALIWDFLADDYKPANRICAILDYAVGEEESAQIMRFYCRAVCDCDGGIEMRCTRERGLTRVILSGAEDQVAALLRRYYSAPANG